MRWAFFVDAKLKPGIAEHPESSGRRAVLCESAVDGLMVTDHRGNEAETEELATTIGLYVLGEISIGKAAQRLDVSRWEITEMLQDNGIQPRLGPTDMEDAAKEIENIREFE
jgi:predicted HTH domain antitoxin